MRLCADLPSSCQRNPRLCAMAGPVILSTGFPVNATKTSLQKVPIYEVRLVQSRRPLRLAETMLSDSRTSARALHALIALTDREHFAALFVNGNHQVTGAHIVAIGAQHAIASIDVRAIFRAALAACASALVLGHNHPSRGYGDGPIMQSLTVTTFLSGASRPALRAAFDRAPARHRLPAL